MKRCYLVCYDISDPKRLRRVFKIVRSFGTPLQLSVFRCQLAQRDKVTLIEKLSQVLHHYEDQVMLVDLGLEGHDEGIYTVVGRSLGDLGGGPTIV